MNINPEVRSEIAVASHESRKTNKWLQWGSWAAIITVLLGAYSVFQMIYTAGSNHADVQNRLTNVENSVKSVQSDVKDIKKEQDDILLGVYASKSK